MYWLDVDQDGTAVAAYCDQRRNGGGWTRIFGLSHDATTLMVVMTSNNPETGIRLATTHEGAISNRIGPIKNMIVFTEIRFFCQKPQVADSRHPNQ